MIEVVRVTAPDEKKALEIGKKELEAKTGQVVAVDKLKVTLVREKKGFLGLKSRKNVYEVTYEEEESIEQKEELLDMVMENLGIDGDFRIRVSDNGIFLRIIPPEGEGDPVHYHDIKTALDKKEIVEVDWQSIQEALNKQSEEWVKIAPRYPELDRDAEAEVEISRDKLKAFMSYKPPLGGKDLTIDDLHDILKESGVVYGIKEDKLIEILEEDEPIDKVLVAEGEEPTPGIDAELVYHFETREESVGTQREDGSIDFYNLGLITNVKPGEVLVTKIDPQPGEPGKTVTGEELPPPKPRDRELPGGKNVERKDDNTLVATVSGQVVKRGNKVSVLPVYEVKGDVDLSVGNIDFVGNVYVRDNVLEGFEIRADGNVEVRGHVSAANIECGGELIIHKGFVGKNKSRIKADGNVRVKFVENGTIEAGKNIIISDAAMHSRLTAGRKIEIKEKKGLLVGGICKAGKELEANIIGSVLATDTRLEVGVDPMMKERLKKIKKEIEEAEMNITKTKKALNIMEQLKKQRGQLPQQKEIMYDRLTKTVKKLESMIESKERIYKQLEEKIANKTRGRLVVNQKIYPGVKIAIGNSQYNVHDEMNRTCFIEDEGEIRQVPV
ncbi:DUF342 domain-containing protein [Halothermothrix orenii]|uniref:Predicted polymerase, contains PALM domain, HD hydrolase domain and Zn-ribbon domain n=1 Tax=Halothermothrix orenii (strain H 168 / OCM 544 / DSM 9562) TaxID=373903 RepID=B8CYP3_HALOH|nr:FapA family protein [Halothermothrix orenii]ACL70412.1 predicted polymerase, contains PALM domain, HD hydrolase domain and Zn-ribbon domain [Halothermothrix orenii H 168]